MKKTILVLGLLVIAAMILAACQPSAPETVVETVTVIETVEVEVEGETVIQTVEVIKTVEVEAEAPPEEETAGGECCDAYRIALFEDPLAVNYWAYLGPNSSVWTQYIMAGNAAALYTLSDQRNDFVNSIATDLVSPVDNGDGTWSMTVEMVQDAKWSDGETIDAHDVVFTHNTCKDLKLTQNWPNQCVPNGVEVSAEALDDFTVQYTFGEAPSLGTWNAGVALAPILPQHFWADQVAESYTYIEGAVAPEIERPGDCDAEDGPADQAACDEWAAYDEMFTNARRTLYEADGTASPWYGGYITDKLEAGAFAQRTANEGFYFKGAEIVQYDDGTWVLNHPNGTTFQLYGDATGEETLRMVNGPYSPNIIMSIYGSQDAAFLALANGEVDYVMNPLGLSRGLREQAEKGEGIETYTNADYGMFYMAFNTAHYPQSEYEFRQAFDIIIDKEFVVNSVLGGVVFPMYSTMPPGNVFWYKEVDTPYIEFTREERVNEAVRVLKEAGWTWTQDPAWSEDLEDVVPGEGLLMPDGNPMPEMTILGPGPAYDPIRATFNQWISEWARELGMPVESELTGFNTILGPVFVDANYDMYILGWSLGNVAFPDYYYSFWHSSQCTLETGNYNTPCFKNDEYDALVDTFMATADLDIAQQAVFDMQDLLADQRPYITLFYKQVHDLARNNIDFPYVETLGGIEAQSGFQTDAVVLTK